MASGSKNSTLGTHRETSSVEDLRCGDFPAASPSSQLVRMPRFTRKSIMVSKQLNEVEENEMKSSDEFSHEEAMMEHQQHLAQVMEDNQEEEEEPEEVWSPPDSTWT